jgi:CheY-like chemotaxis protein
MRLDACVLIVDDEEDTRETLREVVEMAGCSAILAANGAEAMSVLSDRHPCLMILDLLMPVMTGMEVIQQIRLRPELAGVAVLISTSAPARAPGGIPVLPKPIEISKVWDFMRQVCSCPAPT